MSPGGPSAQVRFDWIKPGSYAIYELSTQFIMKLNETDYWDVDYYGSARYGFKILEVDDRCALLRVWLNESTMLPLIFNTSSLSCLIWVDIKTRNLVDRETGEVWGKCPFWIYPNEAGRKDVVALTDFFGRKIVWDNITMWGEVARSAGYSEPIIIIKSPIGYFTNFDLINAYFSHEMMVINLSGSYSVEGRGVESHGTITIPEGSSSIYLYHAEEGLLLEAGLYADDILIKKFGIICSRGDIYYTRLEYSSGKWSDGTMTIYDTNILRGREEQAASPIPLAIATVAAIPAVYYILLRRRLRRS
ncbi:MAG: hypothetical protein QW304_06485 [Thermoproteota archaeon]